MASNDQRYFPMNLRLPMYLDQFIKDFAFHDITNDLSKADMIFTDTEMKRILDIEDSEQQVIQMFFFLYEKNEELVWRFIGILEKCYHWLMVTNYSMNQINDEERLYKFAYDRLGKVEPKHQDINVHRLKYFSELRTSLINLQPHHYVILFGNLGCGKKWLAIDVCKDYAVLKSTNFSIHWLDMSDCISEEKDLEKLKKFANTVFPSIDTTQSKDVIVKDIREAIKSKDKECLLVLTEVQNKHVIKLFDFDTKVLITTRNKNIRDYYSKYFSKVLTVEDSFTFPEGAEFLQKIGGNNTDSVRTSNILEETKSHPFLLATLARNLVGKPPNVWEEAISDTKTNSMMLTKIHNSLNVFNNEEKFVFDHFVIFQHSVEIPVLVISKFCEKSLRDMETILRKFEKFSVVKLAYLDDKTMVCSQKYIYQQYLRNNASLNVSISDAHRRLVNIYDLKNPLENPNDSTSFIKNDHYFYSFIGYHLQKAGMKKMLQRLYLDFRFLGQNIIANGCQKTCGDFKRYKEEIVGHDKHNELLYYELLMFLPTVEEYLDKQSDSNLLHFALNSEVKIIKEEATRQASRIPSSVFFKSHGFQDGKQICRIRGTPTHIKLLNADTCLVSLKRSETYLADLYLGYNTKPTVLVKKASKNIEVVKSEIFNHDILLTLDSQGTLSTWDISHEKRPVKRASSTRLVDTISSHNPEKYKTSIQDLNSSQIVCYHLNEDGRLLTGNSEGVIEMRKWKESDKKFQKMLVENTHTRTTNMAYIHDLGKDHCLVIDSDGSVFIVHFKDSFVESCKILLSDRRGKLLDVHSKPFNKGNPVFYLVFEKLSYSIEFLPSIHDDSYHNKPPVLLFESKYTVKCSKIWRNRAEEYFLVLGTSRNLLLFDLAKLNIVLWCYSEMPIICLDIYDIVDDDYQLVINTGLENKKYLLIHAVTGDLKWAYANNASGMFPPNVRIKSGRNEFSVAYNGCDDFCAMFAMDNENNLHKFCTNRERFPIEVPGNVTVLAASAKNCFFGCDNGDIFNFKTGNKVEMGTKSKISYLKVVDNILVASTEEDTIFFYEIHDSFKFSIEGQHVLDTLSVKNNVLALVTAKFICLWDVSRPNEPRKNPLYKSDEIQHSDVRSNTLIFTTNTSPPTVNIYKIGDFSFRFVLKENLQVRSEITKIALSHNAQVFAVGLESGTIEIYSVTPRIELLFVLKSHEASISDLKFSPWDNSYPTLPIVLASCSEKLCFWDISYAIKNKIKHKNLDTQSSRYSSPSRKDKSVEAFVYPDPSAKPPDSNLWNGKKGISGKPELITCVKFNGNKVEKLCCNENFTRFNTIDDSGGYYDLQVKQIVSSES